LNFPLNQDNIIKLENRSRKFLNNLIIVVYDKVKKFTENKFIKKYILWNNLG